MRHAKAWTNGEIGNPPRHAVLWKAAHRLLRLVVDPVAVSTRGRAARTMLHLSVDFQHAKVIEIGVSHDHPPETPVEIMVGSHLLRAARIVGPENSVPPTEGAHLNRMTFVRQWDHRTVAWNRDLAVQSEGQVDSVLRQDRQAEARAGLVHTHRSLLEETAACRHLPSVGLLADLGLPPADLDPDGLDFSRRFGVALMDAADSADRRRDQIAVDSRPRVALHHFDANAEFSGERIEPQPSNKFGRMGTPCLA